MEIISKLVVWAGYYNFIHMAAGEEDAFYVTVDKEALPEHTDGRKAGNFIRLLWPTIMQAMAVRGFRCLQDSAFNGDISIIENNRRFLKEYFDLPEDTAIPDSLLLPHSRRMDDEWIFWLLIADASRYHGVMGMWCVSLRARELMPGIKTGTVSFRI